MSFAPTSPFWVSNQGSGNSTLYDGAGNPQALVVATPPGGPTGQVFNSTAGFLEPTGGKALFIFDTLAGTIDAWNGSNGTTAVTMVPPTGGHYTGLALANNGSGDFLYAANFAAGKVDIFNSSFAPVVIAGAFVDPSLPAGFGPYNIQNIGGSLFVEYAAIDPAPPHKALPGAGLGFVSVFDANGGFVRRLISAGPLNAPWGVTMSPGGFAEFSNDLLVGNFGDGTINAFDPLTGALKGTLSDNMGNPIVNSGLWAINFRTGGPRVNTSTLYFTAGINGEADGLFGSIAIPEPGTVIGGGLGLLLLVYARRRNRKGRESAFSGGWRA